MNKQTLYNRAFDILIICFIISVVTDLRVSYTVYYYSPVYFMDNEYNLLFKSLVAIDINLATILIGLYTVLILWILVYLRRAREYCLKDACNKKIVSFIGMISLGIPVFSIFYHLIGALSWIVY